MRLLLFNFTRGFNKRSDPHQIKEGMPMCFCYCLGNQEIKENNYRFHDLCVIAKFYMFTNVTKYYCFFQNIKGFPSNSTTFLEEPCLTLTISVIILVNNYMWRGESVRSSTKLLGRPSTPVPT